VIWLNAWALIGLAGVALPVLIHLLARGHAKTYRFPSLRFLDTSRLLPTRRSRVQDPFLLALRCAIVALAALALAQPVLLTARRKRAIERGVARAIVVDTSASMRRPTPSGPTALDSARRVARSLADMAAASVVVETSDPSRAIRGAASWLAKQYQRPELVVVSDFQRGQVDSVDMAAIAADVSVTLYRVPVVSAPSYETEWSVGDRRIAVRAVPRGEVTDAEWSATKASIARGAVTLLGAETDQATIPATRVAAAMKAVPLPTDSIRAVAIVFPGYASRRALDSTKQSALSPWMVDLLRRADPRNDDVQRSRAAVIGNRRQLFLFADSAPATLASMRLTAMADSATSVWTPLAELEPETLSDGKLRSLERPARNASLPRTRDPNGESDARWLWAAVFALLLIELPLRRLARRPAAPTVEERARAA
jgi:hypothetical protein